MLLPTSCRTSKTIFFRKGPKSEYETTNNDEYDKPHDEYSSTNPNEHASKSMVESPLAGSTKNKLKKNRRGRRGKRGEIISNSNSNKFSIFFSNIRGARSKLLSLQSIVNNPVVDPEVIALVETNLRKTSKLQLDGFKCFSKNRQTGNMGGVAVLVKESDSSNVIKAAEGSDENEFLVTRHNQFSVPINVMTLYGEQESRTKVDKINKNWNTIMNELVKIEERNEETIICGDFNKLVGNIIPGNKPKVSHGGHLVREFLSSGKYVLLNSTNKVTNGPFTRYDPSAPNSEEKKSALDLIIVSKNLEKFFVNMTIDNSLDMTPCRPRKKGNVIYPDHYAILVTFKNIPKKENKVRNGIRNVIWNTKKEGGWEDYYRRTNDNIVFNKISETYISDPIDAIHKINSEMKNIKFKAFGKVSVNKNKKKMSKLDRIFRDKNHERVQLGEELNNVQCDKIQTEQNALTLLKKEKGRAAAVFKLKENIVGPKKNPLDPVILTDPETGFDVMEAEDIKRVSLRYCVKLLTNRAPKEKYVEQFKRKERLHLLRMQECIEQDVDELSLGMFNKTLELLAKKKADKYRFIIKGGQSLINAIYNTFASI